MRGLEEDIPVREALTGEDVLLMPVVFQTIDLGHVVDLLVDLEQARVVALEVLCGDEAIRFLPMPAARIGRDEIDAGSPLALLEAAHGRFYHERGRPLRALRGAQVTRAEAELGRVEDVVLLADGQIVELVLDAGSGGRRVPLDERVSIASAPTDAG